MMNVNEAGGSTGREGGLALRGCAGAAWWRTLAGLAWLGLGLLCSRGEPLVTLEQARVLAFPEADQFVSGQFSVDAAMAKQLDRRYKIKARTGRYRYWVARRGTNLLGVALFDQVPSKHQMIDYLVALSPDGAVHQIEILEYRERYGSQVRDEKWRRQFRGKKVSDPVRLQEDIVNISGATISSRNVTDGVKKLLVLFDTSVRPGLAGDGRRGVSDTEGAVPAAP